MSDDQFEVFTASDGKPAIRFRPAIRFGPSPEPLTEPNPVIATWSPCCRILRDGIWPERAMHDSLCRKRVGGDGELGPTILLRAAPEPLTEPERQRYIAQAAELGAEVERLRQDNQALRDEVERLRAEITERDRVDRQAFRVDL